jgi:catechol 2,3-dioxygenase-like lactoylglutathione lyase family enzyme/extradiol dioxygenase family protein
MPIREFFHLIHVVDDIEAANERFGALFGSAKFRENWSDLDRRWASFTMLGDMMLELIQPRHEEEDRHSALTKFHRRFGQHLHSLSWYVDKADMPALYAALRADGVRVAKAGGGLFPDDSVNPGPVMFTHPKDTGGQLEFVAVEGRAADFDPRSSAGWAPPPPEESPLTTVGVSHFTTSTRDLPRLQGFYERVLGAETLRHDDDSAFLRVGTDSLVELATPTVPGSLLERDVAANGELPHSVTFRVADLEVAERHAATVGVRSFDRTGPNLVLHPDDLFGAVLVFTEKPPHWATDRG